MDKEAPYGECFMELEPISKCSKVLESSRAVRYLSAAQNRGLPVDAATSETPKTGLPQGFQAGSTQDTFLSSGKKCSVHLWILMSHGTWAINSFFLEWGEIWKIRLGIHLCYKLIQISTHILVPPLCKIW